MEGANTASHIGLWVIVVGLGIFLTWSAVNKKSDIDNYAKGANHVENHYTSWPLSFACTPVDIMESLKPKTELKK